MPFTRKVIALDDTTRQALEYEKSMLEIGAEEIAGDINRELSLKADSMDTDTHSPLHQDDVFETNLQMYDTFQTQLDRLKQINPQQNDCFIIEAATSPREMKNLLKILENMIRNNPNAQNILSAVANKAETFRSNLKNDKAPVDVIIPFLPNEQPFIEELISSLAKERALYFSKDRYATLSATEKYATFLQASIEHETGWIENALSDSDFFTHPAEFLKIALTQYPKLHSLIPYISKNEQIWATKLKEMFEGQLQAHQQGTVNDGEIIQQFQTSMINYLHTLQQDIQRDVQSIFSFAFKQFINELCTMIHLPAAFKKTEETHNKQQAFQTFKQEYGSVIFGTDIDDHDTENQSSPRSSKQ